MNNENSPRNNNELHVNSNHNSSSKMPLEQVSKEPGDYFLWRQVLERDFGSAALKYFDAKFASSQNNLANIQDYYYLQLKIFDDKVYSLLSFVLRYFGTRFQRPSIDPDGVIETEYNILDRWVKLSSVDKGNALCDAKIHYNILLRFLTKDNIINTGNATPIYHAVFSNDYEIIVILAPLQAAVINKQCVAGFTALMWVAISGHKKNIYPLLAVPGIRVDEKNAMGLTAFDFAEKEIAVILFVHLLKNSYADRLNAIMSIPKKVTIRKEDVYLHLLALVDNEKNANDKIKFIEFAIKTTSTGDPVHSLSRYLHQVERRNNVIIKLQAKIIELDPSKADRYPAAAHFLKRKTATTSSSTLNNQAFNQKLYLSSNAFKVSVSAAVALGLVLGLSLGLSPVVSGMMTLSPLFVTFISIVPIIALAIYTVRYTRYKEDQTPLNSLTTYNAEPLQLQSQRLISDPSHSNTRQITGTADEYECSPETRVKKENESRSTFFTK